MASVKNVSNNKAAGGSGNTVEHELYRHFGRELFTVQPCADGIVTLWIARERLLEVL